MEEFWFGFLQGVGAGTVFTGFVVTLVLRDKTGEVNEDIK